MNSEANASLSNSLTVIVPCYNEENNIRDAMKNLWVALEGIVHDFEILLINDASTDRTGEILEEIKPNYPKTKVIHLKKNRGMGYVFFYGLAQGTKNYITVFVGDNEIDPKSFRNLLCQIGKADIITAFHSNPEVRPFHRRCFSKLFTILVQLATRTRLRYYNGPAIHRREDIMKLAMQNDGFGFLAEITTALLQQGKNCLEFPILFKPRQYGLSQALQWKSIRSVLNTLGRMAMQRYAIYGTACY